MCVHSQLSGSSHCSWFPILQARHDSQHVTQGRRTFSSIASPFVRAVLQSNWSGAGGSRTRKTLLGSSRFIRSLGLADAQPLRLTTSEKGCSGGPRNLTTLLGYGDQKRPRFQSKPFRVDASSVLIRAVRAELQHVPRRNDELFTQGHHIPSRRCTGVLAYTGSTRDRMVAHRTTLLGTPIAA